MGNVWSSLPRSAGEVVERSRGERVARTLHAAFCRGASRNSLLALVVDKVVAWGAPITGAYAYTIEGTSLQLATHVRPDNDHSRIELESNGVTWAAVQDALSEFAFTAPIHLHDLILGALAITSQQDRSIGDESEADVTIVADALATLL